MRQRRALMALSILWSPACAVAVIRAFGFSDEVTADDLVEALLAATVGPQ